MCKEKVLCHHAEVAKVLFYNVTGVRNSSPKVANLMKLER